MLELLILIIGMLIMSIFYTIAKMFEKKQSIIKMKNLRQEICDDCKSRMDKWISNEVIR